jgi:hypothetical protein
VFCVIVIIPLPLGKNPFAVKHNNNNNKLNLAQLSGQLHSLSASSRRKELLMPIAQKAGWTSESVFTLWTR